MRFLGFTISFKRESRWVPREEFIELSRVVFVLSEDVKSALNGVEAMRKRIERHTKKDGDIENESVAVVPPARRVLQPGDVLTPEEIAQL